MLSDSIKGDTRSDSTPSHQLSLRGSYYLLPNLQLNMWGRYVDSIRNYYFSQNGGQYLDVDGGVIMDANLIWTPRQGLELMLAAQNILDSRRLNFVSEYATPPTEIERSVFGKITWKF